MIGRDVLLQEGVPAMKVLALLLAAFFSKGEPIELWTAPLPYTLAKIRLTKGRSFYAPTKFYFRNLKFGCTILAKDLVGIRTCQQAVEKIAALSTHSLGNILIADGERNFSLYKLAETRIKEANVSATEAERLYDLLLKLYPGLPAFGNLPEKTEA